MRGRFRIVDRECLDILRALRDTFDDEGIPFALAGGMGVQAFVASAGLDHLLRSTGDLDVVIDADDTRIVKALNVLASSRPGLTIVQNPAAKNARVGALNLDWINDPARVRGMEQAWARSIQEAHVVRVRRLELPIQEPHVLVAAKLTGQRLRPQDELDVAAMLQSGVVLDASRVKDLIAARPERFELFEALRARLGGSAG
ncbi:MAG: hypothetical protein HYV07_23885 [Deltaproteobacteria bacterium]|nr:hypothetical protein [Deltaproteobacteria bacterium]